MVLDYLRKKNVRRFMRDLKNSDCFNKKNNHGFSPRSIPMSSEVALFIFYDALLKYKIIVDDDYLVDEYIEQIEKLYRKMNSFEDIRFGIHKLLAKMVSIHYEIHDWKTDGREELLTILYNHYIENGFVYHGFSSVYENQILKKGFNPEEYQNFYERFERVKEIFESYHLSAPIHKDFSEKKSFFTDDGVMGFYYSMYSPMYFFQFLTDQEVFGKRIRIEDYLKGDFDHLISPLKRFMNNNMFRETDKIFILNLVRDEWDLLQEEDRKLCLLVVPRCLVIEKEVPLSSYLRDDSDLYEVIDRMLSSKYSNLAVRKKIDADYLGVVSFPHYYEKKKDLEEEKEKLMAMDHKDFLNAYGNVSYLLLCGSLFISFGVILSVIAVLRG